MTNLHWFYDIFVFLSILHLAIQSFIRSNFVNNLFRIRFCGINSNVYDNTIAAMCF